MMNGKESLTSFPQPSNSNFVSYCKDCSHLFHPGSNLPSQNVSSTIVIQNLIKKGLKDHGYKIQITHVTPI